MRWLDHSRGFFFISTSHTHIKTGVETHAHNNSNFLPHILMYTCVRARTHTHTHTHTLTHTHTHTDTHTQTYTHSHTHTHSQTRTRSTQCKRKYLIKKTTCIQCNTISCHK